MFTVPYGGGGLYYFSMYLLVDDSELAYFNIVVNDVIACTARGDHENNGDLDSSQAMCSALVDVAAGKWLFIFREMKLICIVLFGFDFC